MGLIDKAMKKILILLLIPLLTFSDPWLIKVTSVSLNTDRSIKFKWVVMTENGVMYYTNKKPKVGDIAFCIDDNDNIVKCK